MPPWLQFVAEHRIILWLIVACGALCFLNSTVFYARLCSSLGRLSESRFVEEAIAEQPSLRRLLSVADYMRGATWIRFAGIVQGLVFLGVGGAGLVLL